MESIAPGDDLIFDARHYIPVLKAKLNEKKALTLLDPDTSRQITPLLEIVERKGSSIDKHIETTFKGLASSLREIDRCFIDARELEKDGPAAARSVFDRASDEGIDFIPVTSISRPADVAAALAHSQRGLAIRLSRNELEAGNIHSATLRFLSHHRLTPEQIDLLVDLGPVDTMVPLGIERIASQFLSEIPPHTDWRTYTLSACAFPSGMGVVERYSHALIDRTDWLHWRDRLHQRRRSLPRLPTYSDAGIQHTRGVEGYDPRYMPRSPAVRYTSGDQWLLIKGESTRNRSEKEQFQELAQRLVSGDLRMHFSGAAHCIGCMSIAAAARGEPGLGSAGAWRRLGTIHHITSVVESLGGLTWP